MPLGDYYTTALACTCPAFRYRGDLGPCKHVKAVQDALQVLKAAIQPWAAVGGAVDLDHWLSDYDRQTN